MLRNEAGQITGWVTVREPEFNDADRAAWFASHAEQHRPRGSHGIPLDEATDAAHQYDWDVPLPTEDFAAKRLNAAQDAYEKAYPDADMKSLLWRVARRGSGTGSQPTGTSATAPGR